MAKRKLIDLEIAVASIKVAHSFSKLKFKELLDVKIAQAEKMAEYPMHMSYSDLVDVLKSIREDVDGLA